MKKLTIILLFLTSILLTSCDNKEDENVCDPETTISNWVTNKKIVVEFDTTYQRNNYTIVDGNKLLFDYNHSGAQCDYISDDEWGERLVFQIDTNTNFEFKDDEILSTNCFYQQYGAWVNHNQYQIKNGIIKGEKISANKWQITVNIETTPLFQNEPPKKIAFTKLFSN